MANVSPSIKIRAPGGTLCLFVAHSFEPRDECAHVGLFGRANIEIEHPLDDFVGD